MTIDERVDAFAKVLTDEGFIAVPAKHVNTLQKWCDDAGLSEPHPSGIPLPYRVHGVYVKDDHVYALIEQNTGLEAQPVVGPEGDLIEGPRDETATVRVYPPVLILESRRGRVCINDPQDRDLIVRVIESLG